MSLGSSGFYCVRSSARGLTAAACFLGVGAWAQAAGAQASSECYFNNMRMVDAQPLMGQKVSTEEVTGNLHYLLYLPEGHDANKKWPVLVFMHGIGEVDAEGDNLNALTKHSLPRVVEDPMWDYPFIVVSPQIANDGWVNHSAEVGAALDRVVAELGGDPNRLYLTGISYGGAGTFAVGIELADRVAALMPVTPGGSVSNWDRRAAIVDTPTWLIIGTQDNQYNANSQRISELEASGSEMFYEYTYAASDEYNDVVPVEALTKKKVFGSYTDIGHDVWHAAYGVYCPTLKAQKTVQYDWLLAQSKDGTPFVDPRDPNAPVGGSGGMPAGGAAGAGGSAGGESSGGTPGTAGGPAISGAGGGPGAAGAAGGTEPAIGMPPVMNGAAQDSGGCSVASSAPGAASSWSALAMLAGAARLLGRRRRARQVTGRR